jgi:GNAT superfamily N-acetyltransferase
MSRMVGLSVSQFGDAWRVMCGDAPAFAETRDEGLDCVFSGLPISFFNIAVVRPNRVSREALQTTARRATAWADTHAVPWFFVVTHEALEDGVDAVAALETNGLVPALHLTGMRAARVAAPSHLPDGLHLRVPDDEAGCAAVVDVNAAAYDTNLDASKPLLGRPSFWAQHTLVLGTKAGAPVSSAAVMDVAGHRYVALVATMPGHQRQGFAEAAMRLALDEARAARGERPTFLHATDAGRLIYARMGYEPVSHQTMFIEKRFLDGH